MSRKKVSIDEMVYDIYFYSLFSKDDLSALKLNKEISEIYGCHRATINLHKNRAIEKIRQKAQKLGVSI